MNIPLTDNPEESFNISIFGIVYGFRQLWNDNGFWTIDIQDVDGNIFVYGVKIITQEFILRQYPQIPFDLISTDDSDPVRDNLSDFILEAVSKDV